MRNYTERILDKNISELLQIFGGIIIEGARGTGKTTTGINASKSYISLDESPEIVAMAQTDPSTVFGGKIPRLIDEWQLAPNVWNSIRHEIDRRAATGQFILTGSATPTDDLTTLNIITAGKTCYTRADGVNVIPLGLLGIPN